MTEILSRIIENVSVTYYFRQVLVVLVLFALGIVFLSSVSGDSKSKDNILEGDVFPLEYRFLLAFPVGLSLLSVCGLLLLIFNIKYSYVTVSLLLGIVVVFMVVYSKQYKRVISEISRNKRTLIVYSLIVLLLALISVSGIISIGYSNDSMYYYSAYPHEIVNRGNIFNGLDVFLTDAGQATAIINTLPFLFGFNETFGIHAFFNINFICIFFYAVYEKCGQFFDKKISTLTAFLSTLLLVTSMPYIFVSKWIIANMYFMGFVFVLVYLNSRFNDNDNSIYIRSLLLLMVSFVRIEGALYAGLIVLTYMMQKNIKKKNVCVLVLPTAVVQILYYVRIFIFMNIKAIYAFMTWQKSIVAGIFLLLVMAYGLLVAEDTKYSALKGKLGILANPVVTTFSGLIVVNGALFIYDRRIFISNVKVFIGNALRNSGWGFFVAVIIVLIALVPKKKIQTLYYEYFCLGFVLVSFAACFARGDGLRVNLFDSSNRVMLQIVPFVVYALVNRYIESYASNGK